MHILKRNGKHVRYTPANSMIAFRPQKYMKSRHRRTEADISLEVKIPAHRRTDQFEAQP